MAIKLSSTSLYLYLKNTANQITVSNEYSVPIGQFWSTSMKIVLNGFYDCKAWYSWLYLMYLWTLWHDIWPLSHDIWRQLPICWPVTFVSRDSVTLIFHRFISYCLYPRIQTFLIMYIVCKWKWTFLYIICVGLTIPGLQCYHKLQEIFFCVWKFWLFCYMSYLCFCFVMSENIVYFCQKMLLFVFCVFKYLDFCTILTRLYSKYFFFSFPVCYKWCVFIFTYK